MRPCRKFSFVRASERKASRLVGNLMCVQSSLTSGAATMGKYVLGWFLGVPVIVLVIVYMLFH